MPETSSRNLLLASLPHQEYARLASDLKHVPLPVRTVLYQAGGEIEHVYFPEAGVVSWVVMTDDGDGVEAGTTGKEGFAGCALLNGDHLSHAQAIVQIPGEGLRMSADSFRKAIQASEPFSALMRRYSQALTIQISQTAACNRLHSVEERLSRWLLLTEDRVGSAHFPLTQDFLAMMLGVRRATVTVSAGTLQAAGFIRYHRGEITILDRERLEATACECYRAVRDQFERLLGFSMG